MLVEVVVKIGIFDFFGFVEIYGLVVVNISVKYVVK